MTLPYHDPARGAARRFALLPILVLLFSISSLHAQKQNNIWFFGRYASVDFNGPAPVGGRGGQIFLQEGGAVACDPATGALLFYTDGSTVWDRFHQPMQNGTGLLGGGSSTQSALILRVPGSPSRYVIVTTAGVEPDLTPGSSGLPLNVTVGACYSVVDLSLNGGRGAVTSKNMRLVKPASEKVTAVRHCNGYDYWIILRAWGNNAFYVFLLDRNGVSSNPVISTGGHAPVEQWGAIGQMKASPNGAWLALATADDKAIELFRFDNASGRVGEAIPLLSDSGGYGVSFSPNSSKLYIANDFETRDSYSDYIAQYDLSSNDPAAIRASLYIERVEPPTVAYGALALGPDGKIYMARIGDSALGVINNPDARGAAMNFVPRGLPLHGTEVVFGLPNFVDADIPPTLCAPPFVNFEFNATICEGSCISFTDLSEGFPTSWEWSFPGAAPSSSTERNPASVCYQTPGTYPVTLAVGNSYGVSRLRGRVVVRAREIEIDPALHPDISHIPIPPTQVGSSRCDSITIHNRSDHPFVLDEKSAYLQGGSGFAIASGQFPIVIPPHERRAIRICYAPTKSGEEHDGLVLVDSCDATIATIYSAGTSESPRAGFSSDAVGPCSRECIDFTDASAQALAWEWRFPGATPAASNEQNPRNICYGEPGDHLVTLIVRNPFGTDTVVRVVNVGGTPRPTLASVLDSDGVMVLAPEVMGGGRRDSVIVSAGSSPVVITSAHLVVNLDYSLPPSQFPLTIPAGESRAIAIIVVPSQTGLLGDTLVIDHPCNPMRLPLLLYADPSPLAAQICSTRLLFTGGAGEGLLRIDAAYPNPSRTRIKVPVEMVLPQGIDMELRCSLHDDLGRQVSTGVYGGSRWRNGFGRIEEHGAFVVDVRGLAQGRYYLRVTIGQNVTTVPVEVGINAEF
jgi:PKD repeat protein